MSKTRKKSAKMNRIHFWTLTARYTRQIVTSIPSFLMLILQVPVLLLVTALIYQKNSFALSTLLEAQTNIYNANTMVFLLIFIGALMGLLNSYREITKERDILRREISGGLDPVSYVSAKLFVQGVIAAIQAAMLCFGSLIFVQFQFSRPWVQIPLYLLTVFLVIFSSASIGLLVSALVKKSESAILPVLLIIIAQVVFCGIFFDLGTGSEIISYLLPTRWGVGSLGALLNINDNAAAITKSVYDLRVFIDLLLLFALTAICFSVTVAVVKRSTKK